VSSGPLQGVRVIDLTHAFAGPYGTMLLADLGADVIKVEPPSGDEMRGVGPFHASDELHAFGGYFQSVNRGKRSIVLDLKTAEGRDTLLALASEADALVESYRVGVMDRLGVSYERLRTINPRLVYASTRGFGDPRTGGNASHAAWPTADLVMQAVAGPLGITGAVDDPVRVGPRIGDIFPATLTALGVIAAIMHAQRTGEGQYVDVAMYDGLLSLCQHTMTRHAYLGDAARSEDERRPLDVLSASDGAIAIAAPSDANWAELCEAMGRPELVHDERFTSYDGRVANRIALNAEVSRWTATRTRAEIVEALGGRVPVAPVNTMSDIFADERTHAREMLVGVDHPGVPEPVLIPGQPIKFSATPAGVAGRAPLLDEHGDEIRAELGPDMTPDLHTDDDRDRAGLEAL
jgi:crotonobetainyl-CoA:carnitine CoA-transferase CaiB-like acyl-CoA transferase